MTLDVFQIISCRNFCKIRINHLDLIGDGDDLADYIIKKKLANA